MNALFARVAVLLVAYGLAGALPAQAQRGYAVFSGSTPTFLPGSPVAVQVVAQAAGDLEVSAFALSIDEALPIIRGNVTKAVVASATARKPVRIARAHIVPNERRDPVTVALGPIPPGAYLLRLRSEKLEATQVAYVSSDHIRHCMSHLIHRVMGHMAVQQPVARIVRNEFNSAR